MLKLLAALLTFCATALSQDMSLTGVGSSGTVCGGLIYYVSSSGNDSNCGNNQRQPWKTIAKVNSSTFPVGATISFQGGQTFSGGVSISYLTAPSNLTITSYGTGKATISSGNSTPCLWHYNIPNLKVNNIICLGGGNATNTTDGIVIPNTSAGTLQGPSFNNIEVSGYGVRCLIVTNAGNNTPSWSGTQITNSHFHDCTGNWQNTLGDFISGCVMIFNKIGDSAANASATITGNTVDHCQGTHDITRRGTGLGIWVSGASGTLISQNIVHDIGANEFSDNNGGACGIIFGNADGYVASFNEVYYVSTQDQDGEGICINPGNGGVTTVGNIVEYNYVHDNELADILIGDFGLAQTFNSIVRFNIVYTTNFSGNSGNSLQFGALSGGASMSTSGSVYNNTFIAASGAQGCTSNRGGGGKLIINYSNNICYGTGSNDARVIMDVSFAGASAIITSNDYYTDSSANQLFVSVDNNVTHFISLSTMQTSGFEKVGGVPVGTVQYPLIEGTSFPSPGPICGGYVAGCPSATILRAPSTLAQPAGANLNTLYGYNVGTQDFYGNAVTASTLPIGASQAAGPAFDAATTAWINTVVSNGGTVSDKQKNRVDILITGLKTDGLFSIIDRMWLFASENSFQSLVDIIGTHTATNVGALPFVAKQGYTATTSTAQYVDTGFNPFTAPAPHFVQNSCTDGAWMFHLPGGLAANNRNIFGPPTSASSFNGLLSVGAGVTSAFIDCNTTLAGTTGYSAGMSTGYYLISRTASTSMQFYLNGGLFGNNPAASAGVENSNWRVGNGADTANTISIGEIGGSMTATQAISLYFRLNTYMGSL